MKLSIIAAVGKNGEIGRNNKLLWHIPDDLKNFKMLTMGRPVLMGRKTYQSIGRSLPGRMNLILTHQKGYTVAGCTIIHSIDEAIDFATAQGACEIFVCGGSEVYRSCLPYATQLYISRVDFSGEADVFFPEVNWMEWDLLSRQEHPACNGHPAWAFEVYHKK